MAFLAAGCSAYSVSGCASSVVVVCHLKRSLRFVHLGCNSDAERIEIGHCRSAQRGI